MYLNCYPNYHYNQKACHYVVIYYVVYYVVSKVLLILTQ